LDGRRAHGWQSPYLQSKAWRYKSILAGGVIRIARGGVQWAQSPYLQVLWSKAGGVRWKALTGAKLQNPIPPFTCHLEPNWKHVPS